MFYTYVEKQSNTLWGAWETRLVAFDTLRRYLYYTTPLPTPVPQPGTTSTTTVHTAHRTRGRGPGTATVTPVPSQSSLVTDPTDTVPTETTTSRRSRSVPLARTRSDDVDAMQSLLASLKWKRKLKVLCVIPVATIQRFVLDDVHLCERDFFQLEITAENRALATGEIPPPGPLLCPSTGIPPSTWWTPQDVLTPQEDTSGESTAVPATSTAQEREERMTAAIEDVYQLRELFEALRVQFDELNYQRRRAAQAAVASGRRAPPQPLSQTLSSPPRTYDAVFPPSRRHITVRCRNEYEMRRFWYVVQTVLGYDKLCARPYRGLPPYDPRNGLMFGQIPMHVWHTFDALDKTVFYTFVRGDLLGMDEDGKLGVCVRGAYLVITHDTVLFMRETGTIPCWMRLSEVRGFEYNPLCDVPFVAFLSDPPAPDVLFVPRAPYYGTEAMEHYSPHYDVRRLHHVMQELCFASLCIRRVIHIRAVRDRSAQAYAQRVAATGHPLCVYPGAGRQSELRALLPKERLVAVWQQVQREMRERGDDALHAAIPLYENTAAQLQLQPAQLHHLQRVLDEERDRLDDIVGIPLHRALQVRAEESPSASHTAHPLAVRPTSHAHSLGTPSTPTPTAHTAHRAVSFTALSPTRDLSTRLSTAASLESIGGNVASSTEPMYRQLIPRPTSTDVAEQGESHRGQHASEEDSVESDYALPGARYVTQEELLAGNGSMDATMVVREQHTVVDDAAGGTR